MFDSVTRLDSMNVFPIFGLVARCLYRGAIAHSSFRFIKLTDVYCVSQNDVVVDNATKL